MSRLPDNAPRAAPDPADPAVETVIVPRTRDLGGFEVRRVLPSSRRRMVGPFVFLDQMGPSHFAAGTGIDVRPHPHIGLATVTYLLDGLIVHRDSLGSVQKITPGDVNWMTAGRGIVHSERSDAEARRRPQSLYGLQFWVALPKRDEETAPSFFHHAAANLPAAEGEGVRLRVVAGSAFGLSSPVHTFSDLFLVDAALTGGARVALAPEHEERAAYLLSGTFEIAGRRWEAGQLLVFAPGGDMMIRAEGDARLALFGGEPMDGPRHIWWNFVSSRPERIEQAKRDWTRDRFGVVVPGDDEFIPLPEER